jgi:hypothetical protein
MLQSHLRPGNRTTPTKSCSKAKQTIPLDVNDVVDCFDDICCSGSIPLQSKSTLLSKSGSQTNVEPVQMKNRS